MKKTNLQIIVVTEDNIYYGPFLDSVTMMNFVAENIDMLGEWRVEQLYEPGYEYKKVVVATSIKGKKRK